MILNTFHSSLCCQIFANGALSSDDSSLISSEVRIIFIAEFKGVFNLHLNILSVDLVIEL